MEKLIGGKSHPRLLLADDHAIFSDALRIYLDKDFDIVSVVSDGRTLIDYCAKQSTKYCVVIGSGKPEALPN